VKVNDKITYYDGANNKLENETAFNALFNGNADLLNPDKAKEAVVTKTSAAIAELEVVNQKGTELPSTGGIGTTIFYVMGSILVICAGVVLVTRRRMAA
jgi:LPXTG-motif cell wall-anchored protein